MAEIQKVMGIANASIGKIMGLAVASVGKVSGIAYPAGGSFVTASGGTETTDGDYKIHSFLNSEIAASSVVVSPTITGSMSVTNPTYGFDLNQSNYARLEEDGPSWIQIDFGGSVKISRIRLRAGPNNPGTQAMTLLTSPDETNWTEIAAWEGQTYYSTLSGWFTVNRSDVRYIRITKAYPNWFYLYYLGVEQEYLDVTVGGGVDYLVVAGGGGGAYSSVSEWPNPNWGGGGGGGGGVLSGNSLAVTAQIYPISVGAGGTPYANGSDSIFSTLTAIGGGKGGAYYDPGSNGGSGGGAGRDAGADAGGTGTAGPPRQGYNGGQAGGSSYSSAGGGGGAGIAGYQGGTDNTNISGTLAQGGAGIASSITGTEVYYGGGGGGAWETGTTPAAGGIGGGGAGAANVGAVAPVAGTVNRGGGGGGGMHDSIGAKGGSGIVIIRYKFQ
jgi:hypothetical protein